MHRQKNAAAPNNQAVNTRWQATSADVQAYIETMSAYYYAAGRRVDLEPDDEHVAVDQDLAAKAGLDSEINTAAASGTRVGGGVLVALRSSLAEKTITSLQKAGALHPVYKRQSAIVVALPEVRIEVDNSKQHRAVMDVLAESGSNHAITQDTPEQIVLRPASGNGDDALKIANDIYERAHPAAASVRFVQFVPKPKTTGS
jgi:hypothetical protein